MEGELGPWHPARLTARLTRDQREALRLSVLATLWSRVLVWEAGMIAARIFGMAQLPNAYAPIDLQPAGRSLGALFTFPVLRWDGDWYLTIARHGYALAGGATGASHLPRTNFFPLYPLIVAALSRCGVPLVLAGAAVSIVAMVAALYVVARLAGVELGRPGLRVGEAPRLAVLALALAPVSFFFSAAYAESLYLALSAGAFLCARRGQWAGAGVLAALVSATRGPGLLLVVPLAWMYLYGPCLDQAPHRQGSHVPRGRWYPRYRLRADAAWLALAPAGLVAYMVYLSASGVGPLAFVHTQREVWHHVLTPPWTTVWHAIRAAWSELWGAVNGTDHLTLFGRFPNASIVTGWENLLPFAALVVALPAAVGVWRRLPVAYGLYVSVAILLNLISPVSFQPLQSLPRYLLVLFPLFLWLGMWLADRPRVQAPLLVLSAALLALLSAEFATWHFVA